MDRIARKDAIQYAITTGNVADGGVIRLDFPGGALVDRTEDSVAVLFGTGCRVEFEVSGGAIRVEDLPLRGHSVVLAWTRRLSVLARVRVVGAGRIGAGRLAYWCVGCTVTACVGFALCAGCPCFQRGGVAHRHQSDEEDAHTEGSTHRGGVSVGGDRVAGEVIVPEYAVFESANCDCTVQSVTGQGEVPSVDSIAAIWSLPAAPAVQQRPESPESVLRCPPVPPGDGGERKEGKRRRRRLSELRAGPSGVGKAVLTSGSEKKMARPKGKAGPKGKAQAPPQGWSSTLPRGSLTVAASASADVAQPLVPSGSYGTRLLALIKSRRKSSSATAPVAAGGDLGCFEVLAGSGCEFETVLPLGPGMLSKAPLRLSLTSDLEGLAVLEARVANSRVEVVFTVDAWRGTHGHFRLILEGDARAEFVGEVHVLRPEPLVLTLLASPGETVQSAVPLQEPVAEKVPFSVMFEGPTDFAVEVQDNVVNAGAASLPLIVKYTPTSVLRATATMVISMGSSEMVIELCGRVRGQDPQEAARRRAASSLALECLGGGASRDRLFDLEPAAAGDSLLTGE